MMTRWFKKEPSPEKIAVEETTERLGRMRDRRKDMLRHLVRKLDELPLEDNLMTLGRTLGDVEKNGH